MGIVLVGSFAIGLLASATSASASLEPAGSVLAQVSVGDGPSRFAFDFSNGLHLAVLTVVAFLVFFVVTFFYVVPNIIRVKKQEKALKGLIAQIDKIEENVCSMGGLGKRLTEIERRTLDLGKKLSEIEVKLGNQSFVEENLLVTRGRA